jgi:hypothetical protein
VENSSNQRLAILKIWFDWTTEAQASQIGLIYDETKQNYFGHGRHFGGLCV